MTVSAVARLMPRPPARVDNRKQNAGDPTAARQHTTIVNTSDLTEPVHVNLYQHVPSRFYSSIGSATVPLRQIGRNHQGVLVSRDWTSSSVTWEPTTSHWMKQSTWLRTVLCEGWCLRMVLHAPSGACHKRRRRIFEDKQFIGWMSFVDVVQVYGTDTSNQQCQSTEAHNIAYSKHGNKDTLHVYKLQQKCHQKPHKSINSLQTTRPLNYMKNMLCND